MFPVGIDELLREAGILVADEIAAKAAQGGQDRRQSDVVLDEAVDIRSGDEGPLLEVEGEKRAVAVIERGAPLVAQPEVECQARSDLPVVLEIRRVFPSAEVEPGPAEGGGVIHDTELEVCQTEARQRLRQRVGGRRGLVIERGGERTGVESAGEGIRGFVDDLTADMKTELELMLPDDLGGVVLNDSVIGNQPEQSGGAERVAARHIRT